MAEQEAVNFKVVGSSPTGGARIDKRRCAKTILSNSLIFFHTHQQFCAIIPLDMITLTTNAYYWHYTSQREAGSFVV